MVTAPSAPSAPSPSPSSAVDAEAATLRLPAGGWSGLEPGWSSARGTRPTRVAPRRLVHRQMEGGAVPAQFSIF